MCIESISSSFSLYRPAMIGPHRTMPHSGPHCVASGATKSNQTGEAKHRDISSICCPKYIRLRGDALALLSSPFAIAHPLPLSAASARPDPTPCSCNFSAYSWRPSRKQSKFSCPHRRGRSIPRLCATLKQKPMTASANKLVIDQRMSEPPARTRAQRRKRRLRQSPQDCARMVLLEWSWRHFCRSILYMSSWWIIGNSSPDFHRHSRWLHIFNNRVLRLPALIVLLTRRFDPETRAFFGYTSKLSNRLIYTFMLLCLEFPGRNVVSIKRLMLEDEELCCRAQISHKVQLRSRHVLQKKVRGVVVTCTAKKIFGGSSTQHPRHRRKKKSRSVWHCIGFFWLVQFFQRPLLWLCYTACVTFLLYKFPCFHGSRHWTVPPPPKKKTTEMCTKI